MKRLCTLSVLGTAFATTLLVGCTTSAFCYDCEEPQDPSQEGGTDGGAAGYAGGLVLDGSPDTFFPIDTGCGADLLNDPSNCGNCGNVCNIDHAFSKCDNGFCVVDRCAEGSWDIDGKADNGCEYQCSPVRDPSGLPIEEELLCDGQDDDCDNLTDEPFSLQDSLEHCGACDHACTAPSNGIMKCEQGKCKFSRCLEGYLDTNHDITDEAIAGGTTDGCECNQLGVEQCNFVDDDCDGDVDEGIDTTTDVNNCGACGNICGDLYPNAVTLCANSTCSFSGCKPGFYEIDGVLLNGCEYECTRTSPAAETCDGKDNDCDGFTDNGVLPGVGEPCGSSTGECELGHRICEGGALVCVGDVKPATELCDGADNNCNGSTDETCPAAPGRVRLDVGGSDPGKDSTAQLSVASHGMNVLATYLDRRIISTTAENANIRLNLSTNGGKTWSASDMVVAGTGSNEVEPWVMVSPTHAYVAHGLFIAGNVRRIQVARGTPSTGTWTSVQAEKSADAERDSFFVRGVVTGQASGKDQLVIVWQSLLDSQRDIYLQASTDGGVTWRTTDLRVNEVAGNAEQPRIATDGLGHAFIAWRDGRTGTTGTYVDVFDAATGTLRGNRALSGTEPTKAHEIAADANGNVHVVWTELPTNARKHVRASTSTNSGASFSASEAINLPAFADADTPSIMAYGGRAVAAWEDNRSGLTDVYVNVWRQGQGWRAAASRADGGARGAYASLDPKVTLGAGELVFVTYREIRSSTANQQADVYVNFSRDGGITFQPRDTRLDPGAAGLADSHSPHILAPAASGLGSEPVIVWLDHYASSAASANADAYASVLTLP